MLTTHGDARPRLDCHTSRPVVSCETSDSPLTRHLREGLHFYAKDRISRHSICGLAVYVIQGR